MLKCRIRLFCSLLTLASLGVLSVPRANSFLNGDVNNFDLSQQTYGNLPVVDEPIDVAIEDGPTIQCDPGESPADCFPVGTLSDLDVGDLTLNDLGEGTGFAAADVPLFDFVILSSQTVDHLVQVVPQLGDQLVENVPPLNDATGGQFAGQLVKDLPADVLNQTLPVVGFTVKDIPNLANTPIGQLDRISESSITGVPGLGDLEFGQFPGGAELGIPLLARVDVVLGTKEANLSQNIITGSVQEGSWSVPCKENCSHLELTNLTGQEAAQLNIPLPSLNFNGARYIAGDTADLVKGGWVGTEQNWPGYGYEPTGQPVVGDLFKASISDVDEGGFSQEASAVLRLNSRYCQYAFGKKVACSPYGVQDGKLSFPVWNLRDKGLIPVAAVGLNPGQAPDLVASAGDTSIATDEPGTGDGNIDPLAGQPEEPAAPVPEEPVAVEEESCPSSRVSPSPGWPITSEFNDRRSCPECSKVHKGTDVGTPVGTPVKAMQDGTVEFAGISPDRAGNGLYTAIKACDDYRYLYLHLDRVSVQAGASVTRGQVIANSGGAPGLARSGNTTGPHLHIHVYEPGGVDINPRNYTPVN